MPDDLRAQVEPLVDAVEALGSADAAHPRRRGRRRDRHARAARGGGRARGAHLDRRQGHGAARRRPHLARQHHDRHAPRPRGREGEVRRLPRADRRLPGAGRRHLRQHSGRTEGGPEDRGQVAQPVHDVSTACSSTRRRSRARCGESLRAHLEDARALAPARDHPWRPRAATGSDRPEARRARPAPSARALRPARAPLAAAPAARRNRLRAEFSGRGARRAVGLEGRRPGDRRRWDNGFRHPGAQCRFGDRRREIRL